MHRGKTRQHTVHEFSHGICKIIEPKPIFEICQVTQSGGEQIAFEPICEMRRNEVEFHCSASPLSQKRR